MAENVSAATTRAIQRWLAWQLPAYDDTALAETVNYSLTADFDASRMDPGELATLTQSLQAGTISWETYSYNLRRGEMLPPGVSDDEERDRIEMGASGRSRKDEMVMLQSDVREGRISQRTYLERVKALGMLGDIEIDAEIAAADEDKARAAEAQMGSRSLTFTSAIHDRLGSALRGLLGCAEAGKRGEGGGRSVGVARKHPVFVPCCFDRADCVDEEASFASVVEVCRPCQNQESLFRFVCRSIVERGWVRQRPIRGTAGEVQLEVVARALDPSSWALWDEPLADERNVNCSRKPFTFDCA